MSRDRCPRCGARLALVEERWRRDDGTLVRESRCPSCGALHTTAAPGRPRRRGASGARWAAVLFWIALCLIGLWFVVRPVPYTSFGPAVSDAARRVAEGFRSTVAVVGLGVLAGITAVAWALTRARPPEAAPVLAPDVHLRTTGRGRLAVVLADEAGALGRDFGVEREPERERRLLAGFDAVARRSTAFAETRVLPADEARREIEESNREVYALGAALSDLGLGDSEEARRRLTELEGDHLLLRIQSDLARLPWELLVPRRGGQYLWQLFHVGRQIRDELGPEGSPRSCTPPLRVLLLANLEAGTPGRALPDAEREAGLLLDLAKARSDLLRVVRRSPGSPEQLKEALDEGFDIVHFASHASYGGAGAVGWVFPGGVATGETLSGLDAPPPLLVFSNACGTGPGTEPDEP